MVDLFFRNAFLYLRKLQIATAIIAYENLEIADQRATIKEPVIPKKNIHWQGSDHKKNELIPTRPTSNHLINFKKLFQKNYHYLLIQIKKYYGYKSSWFQYGSW